MKRITKGKKVIGSLNSILWSKTISKERKKQLALEIDFWCVIEIMDRKETIIEEIQLCGYGHIQRIGKK